MTRDKLISSIPAELLQRCMEKDPELTTRAMEGCLILANTTGWLAQPEEEVIGSFLSACHNFINK